LTLAEVDRVEALWKSMVGHHREVVDGAFPVRDAEGAWQRRRLEYVEWLSSGEGTILAAVPAADTGSAPLGYAALLPNAVGATWELGDRIGEVESLVVAPTARGEGIGGALLEAAREHFRRQGFEYWSVAVVEANVAAAALYERAGMGPYYRQLLGRVDEA
jgi:ribosomal protein S18 acetylase RimI-like enzyme